MNPKGESPYEPQRGDTPYEPQRGDTPYEPQRGDTPYNPHILFIYLCWQSQHKYINKI
jgi:hypothetical protein